MQVKDYKHLIIFSIISFLIILPLLPGKYVMTLDTILSPSVFLAPKNNNFVYGLGSDPNQDELGLSMQRLPLMVASSGLQNVIPTFILQKIFMFLIFFLSMWSMFALIQTKSSKSPYPAYFAALFYAINPFVYLRFMAGHWLLLLAYAILPFFVKELMQKKKRVTPIVLWLTVIGIINLHMMVLAFIILFVFIKKDEFQKYGVILGLFLLLNLYWIIPALLSSSTILTEISGNDAIAFETNKTFSSLLVSVAMMYGFWREAAYDIPIFVYLIPLFAIIFYFLVNGTLQNSKYKNKFLIIGLLGFVLALGSAFPLTKDLFLSLFSNIPLMNGFREPHKFVALLVLAYCFLAATGISQLKNKKIQAALLVLPFLFSPMIFFGFNGQLKSVDYPSDYYEVNRILNQDKGSFNVLFLPWHLYMDFAFIENKDRRIANPAAIFFDKPTIRGDNMEVLGIYSSSTSPISNYIVDNLNGTAKDLQLLGVRYVIVAREFDQDVSDATLISETKNLKLFKNNFGVHKIIQTDDFEEFEAVSFQKVSPIRYKLGEVHHKYIVFTESRNDKWLLGDQKPLDGYPVNVYEYKGENTVKHSGFKFLFLGYLLSSIVFIVLIKNRKKF